MVKGYGDGSSLPLNASNFSTPALTLRWPQDVQDLDREGRFSFFFFFPLAEVAARSAPQLVPPQCLRAEEEKDHLFYGQYRFSALNLLIRFKWSPETQFGWVAGKHIWEAEQTSTVNQLLKDSQSVFVASAGPKVMLKGANGGSRWVFSPAAMCRQLPSAGTAWDNRSA